MSFFKLGKMTFGSLFKKPATTKYPFETRPQPMGLKGQIGIEVSKCILCGACERNCTTGTITVNKAERYWQINRYGCVQCGYCISVCPKSCLYMLPDYAPATDEKIANRFDIPEGDATPKAVAADARAEAQVAAQEASGKPAVAPAKPAEDLPSKETVKKIETEDLISDQTDYQIEDILALMDDDRAEKVRKALRK